MEEPLSAARWEQGMAVQWHKGEFFCFTPLAG